MTVKPSPEKSTGRKLKNRLLLVLFTPILLVLICCSVTVGLTSLLNATTSESVTTLLSPSSSVIATPENLNATGELQQDVDKLLSQGEITPRLSSYLQKFLLNTSLSVAAIPLKIIFVVLAFIIAFLISQISGKLASWLMRWNWLFTQPTRYLGHLEDNEPILRYEYQQTAQQLIGSIISLIAFGVATFVSLAQFMNAASLAVIGGLLTTGIGFGARTMIGDLLSGMSNIFEDNFNVGEKVEIQHVTGNIEGVVERMTVRVVSIRAGTGEMYVVPQGEVRVLRNFSRGRFSVATIQFKIAIEHLDETLALLEEIKLPAVNHLENLLEPWLVLNETGMMGKTTELKLRCRANYAKGSELRLNLLEYVRNNLARANIEILD